MPKLDSSAVTNPFFKHVLVYETSNLLANVITKHKVKNRDYYFTIL